MNMLTGVKLPRFQGLWKLAMTGKTRMVLDVERYSVIVLQPGSANER